MPAEPLAPCPAVTLLVFAKAPIAGSVKPRLMPSLDADQARDVHVALLERTLAVAVEVFPAQRIQLWTALQNDHPTLKKLAARHAIVRHPQRGADLGQRMYHAWASQTGPALVIGSDCPVLSATLLRRCVRALDDHDLVLLPAEDGGYALIGGKRSHRGLFEAIAWGTGDVTAQTLERARALALRVACPATVWDVDTPRDLERWRAIKL